MTTTPIDIGDVLLIALPTQQPPGREQAGRRPAIVVGLPRGQLRYPMIWVAPLTTQRGDWTNRNPALYPDIHAGIAGLTQNSIVLLDQIRSLDMQRIIGYIGTLPTDQYQPLFETLQQIIGVDRKSTP